MNIANHNINNINNHNNNSIDDNNSNNNNADISIIASNVDINLVFVHNTSQQLY